MKSIILFLSVTFCLTIQAQKVDLFYSDGSLIKGNFWEVKNGEISVLIDGKLQMLNQLDSIVLHKYYRSKKENYSILVGMGIKLRFLEGGNPTILPTSTEMNQDFLSEQITEVDKAIFQKLEDFRIARNSGFMVQLAGLVVTTVGGILLSPEIITGGGLIFVAGWIIQWNAGSHLKTSQSY